jgi:hypothetical protein
LGLRLRLGLRLFRADIAALDAARDCPVDSGLESLKLVGSILCGRHCFDDSCSADSCVLQAGLRFSKCPYMNALGTPVGSAIGL